MQGVFGVEGKGLCAFAHYAWYDMCLCVHVYITQHIESAEVWNYSVDTNYLGTNVDCVTCHVSLYSLSAIREVMGQRSTNGYVYS